MVLVQAVTQTIKRVTNEVMRGGPGAFMQGFGTINLQYQASRYLICTMQLFSTIFIQLYYYDDITMGLRRLDETGLEL
jgi:hypothetical protein